MKSQKPRSEIQKLPNNFGVLGKEIKISPKAQVSNNGEGFSIKFHVPTVDVLIGIGKNHVAYLLMDEDAWRALNKGEDVHVTTLKEFKKQFIDPKKGATKKRKLASSKK